MPLIWDMKTRRIVSNDVAQITIMLETEFRPFHRPGVPDLYPSARRRDIESLATLIFHTVNTGVYKAGLATTQPAYDQAVEALFTTLDALDERLARRRFLLGDMLTEADIRLYPTLARFDSVYYQMFNCNLRRLTDYPICGLTPVTCTPIPVSVKRPTLARSSGTTICRPNGGSTAIEVSTTLSRSARR